MERECPVCGVSYEADAQRLRHGRQTTCSRQCSYELRGSKNRDRSVVPCAMCGKEFTRTPSQIKAQHGSSYCSRACHYAGRRAGLTARVVTRPYVRVAPVNLDARRRAAVTRRARNKHLHGEHTRRRLSEAVARAVAEGRFQRVSGLEDEVAKMLDGLGVPYERQVGFRSASGRFVAVVDFMVGGAALEVNGTFWHADPRFYPDGPVTAAQRRTAACWGRKVAALVERGIPLKVVWEHDVREHGPKALLAALA